MTRCVPSVLSLRIHDRNARSSWQLILFRSVQLIYLNYTGTVTVGPAETAALDGTAEEGLTPFGNSCTSDATADCCLHTML
jgi:hypothetical protein